MDAASWDMDTLTSSQGAAHDADHDVVTHQRPGRTPGSEIVGGSPGLNPGG